jgi:hypothetical protein
LALALVATACSDTSRGDDGLGGSGDGDGTGGSSGGGGSGDGSGGDGGTGGDSGGGGSTDASGTGNDPKYDVGIAVDTPNPEDCWQCSADLHEILDCDGHVVEVCPEDEACDSTTWTCEPACIAVAHNKSSVGCHYWATKMDMSSIYDAQGVCYAAYVANTWTKAVKIDVEYDGVQLAVEDFARIPQGAGPGLTLEPYDGNVGLPPGEVAILFLSGPTGEFVYGKVPCPVTPAIPETHVIGTGIGNSFFIAADVPVVAYQINPYGAGVGAAVAGASLLLPTSAWDTNYVGVSAYEPDLSGEWPSMNVIADEDDTVVTMLPVAAVEGGGGLPSGPADVPLQFTLQRGEHAQLTQAAPLTGSIISSSEPIGLMAGQNGLRVPVGVAFADHAEQMIPPVRALGHEYVGVMHRQRGGEPAIWRLVGAVDGTVLDWSDDVGGPITLSQGEVVEFHTAEPFVVQSQDEDHPFLLFIYMSGSQWNMLSAHGHGDADFVISVPPQQYLSGYVFFMDPSYPEANIVVIRDRVGGTFHPVELDCYGELDGWEPVGEYEYTRLDLMTGDYVGQNGCSTGRHQIESDGAFGLWVWGWGTPLTTEFTENRSYGYPGGMNVRPINDVELDPEG